MARMAKGRFARGTASQKRRSRIAEDIHADNPGMPMSEKMAIATNIVKGKKMKHGKEKRGSSRFGSKV